MHNLEKVIDHCQVKDGWSGSYEELLWAQKALADPYTMRPLIYTCLTRKTPSVRLETWFTEEL